MIVSDVDLFHFQIERHLCLSHSLPRLFIRVPSLRPQQLFRITREWVQKVLVAELALCQQLLWWWGNCESMPLIWLVNALRLFILLSYYMRCSVLDRLGIYQWTCKCFGLLPWWLFQCGGSTRRRERCGRPSFQLCGLCFSLGSSLHYNLSITGHPIVWQSNSFFFICF